MDLGFKDHNNRTPTKNTSATAKSFAVWEDYKSSVDDIQYFLIGLYTFISLAGFMGNLFILMALMKRKQKTTINILIGNLAFSDILVVLFCSPFTLTSVLLDQWMFGSLMCHVMPFLQCASVLVSTLMLMSIAVVRYRMIKHPLSSNLTAKQGYILIATVWALGCAICSPLPIFHKVVDLSKTLNLEELAGRFLCIESWPSDSYRIAFTISLLFLQYILPLVCLTASHTSVCRSIGSRLSNTENKFEEHEMINLTFHPSKSSGTWVQPSRRSRWSFAFVRKHHRRYSKKTSSVMPAILRHHEDANFRKLPESSGTEKSQLSSSSKFIPGVPICFEMKPKENTKIQDMITVSQSIIRIKTRSRRVFCRLTVLILVFAFSWMPLHLFHIVTDFNANLISNRHFKLVYCICHLLGMMSCCLNPILYGFLNNSIKADLLSLIPCSQIP
nr:PREDICTED: neuropeptide Y receptor type 5 [Struthio camelus australis]XP_009675457.1 PREDICTED: neuropeptide Y receptor type 5 [Struthio camelus australis]XP_009675458.1 PREDICTED: neuropeptide Y receptor type 5 [Struthio camelus australis]XP_009675459.1 PREDICTED: neuropeptide Y receptor type 5 [Struthio camelus australis]XP_009675460.1 PREDICTED: neuropeptide Y receptor type 5 [Struthio camelus australis]